MVVGEKKPKKNAKKANNLKILKFSKKRVKKGLFFGFGGSIL